MGKNGKLETGGALPANATHYTKLLLTLETQNAPKTPGPIVLQGAFKITGSELIATAAKLAADDPLERVERLAEPFLVARRNIIAPVLE